MTTATKRKRRRWLWLAVLATLGLGTYVALRSLLEPERLSAFLLRQASEATGLVFTLEQPAGTGLWPDLHLELSGLEAHVPGTQTRVLRIERLDAVLPWSALRDDTLQLRSLRLQAPTLDLAALRTWLAARSDAGPPAPFRLPRLDTELVASGGRIEQGDMALTEVNLRLDRLHPGEISSLSLSAVAVDAGQHRPIDLQLRFIPHQRGDELRLEDLVVQARDTAEAAPWLEAAGVVALRYPQHLSFDLDATMPTWPANWPSLPLPEATDDASVHVKLVFDGTPDLQGMLSLILSRGDERITGELHLGEWLAWMAAPAASPLPPVRGSIDAARLQFDGVELRGVRLRVQDDAEPATDASD